MCPELEPCVEVHSLLACRLHVESECLASERDLGLGQPSPQIRLSALGEGQYLILGVVKCDVVSFPCLHHLDSVKIVSGESLETY